MAAPCSWDLAGQTDCCSEFWGELTPDEQAAAAAAATFVLWAATGRQFGPCPVTVRPCGRWPCEDGIGGWYWNQGVWTPYVLDGQWFNCACGATCTCGARCKIYLPGPVAAVSAVTLDGVLVDPSTYRVDDYRWLARTGTDASGAPNCWPTHQDFDKDSGTDTLIVSYTRGTPVPSYLLAAAGTYACEWAKMCRGDKCLIPSRVVTLTRQGTTFQNVDLDVLLDRGLTGIQSVDQIIALVNPYGLKGRSILISPDIEGPIMTSFP